MANISSPLFSSSSVPSLAVSASSTVPSSVNVTTSFVTPTQVNISMANASPLLSSTAACGTPSFSPSNTSVISDCSPQPTSNASLNATVPSNSSGTTSITSTFLSSLGSGSEPSTQTSTPIVQATSLVTSLTSASAFTAFTSANVLQPLPTSLGSSTESPLTTFTQVGSTLSTNSFFDNHGAVIGTFVAVAIFSTAILVCLCLGCRRLLRRRARHNMVEIDSITSYGTGRGFQEGPHLPTVKMIGEDDTSLTPGVHDTLFHGVGFGGMRTTGTAAPAAGNTTTTTGQQSHSPFGDHFALNRAAGNVTNATGQQSHVPSGGYFALNRAARRLTGLSAITEISRIDSPTPSTPSFYPPSLPPTETEEDPMWSVVYSTLNSMPSVEPPPRPPRRRPLPPSSRIVTEAATVLPSAPAPAVVSNVVPPGAVPHTRVNLTVSTSAKDPKHEISKPSEEFQLLSPVSSISVYSQTDSRRSSATITAPALDHSADGELKNVHTLLLRRALVGTRAGPLQV